LKRIFGFNWQGVRWGWGKLHNEQLHNLYSSIIIIKMMKSRWTRWTGHTPSNGEEWIRNAYKILAGEPERKRPHGRSKTRWRIIIECLEMGYWGGELIYLSNDRVPREGFYEQGN
jgi:hypothetical protein